MKRRRNRQLALQRFQLGILGTLVTATAVTGLLLTTRTVGRVTAWAVSSAPLLNPSLDDALRNNTGRFQAGALGTGAVLLLVGAVWLRGQIPPVRHQQSRDLPNTSGEVDGRNVVDGPALARALAEDLEGHPAVQRAVAEVRPNDGLLRLQVSAADTLGLSELQSTVIAPAIERASTVGGFDVPLSTEIDVRFIEPERSIA